MLRQVPPDLSERAIDRSSTCTEVEVTERSNHEPGSTDGVGWERVDADQL